MKQINYLTLTASPQLHPAVKPRSFASLSLQRRSIHGRERRCNAGKELDNETGLYYYGARYLDPKTSRWLSGDPAVGEYVPSAPVSDEARKQNQNLPGMGGVFNYANLHVYHYAGNNPVKYTDPDGRAFNFPIGAVAGFASSAATEIGGRMATGQSFGTAVQNTFSSKKSWAIMVTSAVIGAVTSGASVFAVNGTVKAIKAASVLGSNTIPKELIATVAINTASGAIDAGAKDAATKAIQGEPQNIGETLGKMGEGAASAFIFSGATQGVTAAKTKFSTYEYNGIQRTTPHPPQWSGKAGVIGENILPTVKDVYQSIYQSPENYKKQSVPE